MKRFVYLPCVCSVFAAGLLPRAVLGGGLPVPVNVSNPTIGITSPGNMTITPGALNSVYNWQSFSIGYHQSVTFQVPGVGASVLNRVGAGGGLSTINGSLSSFFNGTPAGNIFLINPNGILIGPSGVINVGSFTASTLDLAPDPTRADAKFLAGGNLMFSGSSTASIVNRGQINAFGDVFLIGHSVDNSGSIDAATVGLASGSEVELKQVGQPADISVIAGLSGTKAAVGVNNSGTIRAISAELEAAGGNLYALAINNSGAIRTGSVINQNGRIILEAPGGDIQNSGTLSAQNGNGSGGSITVDAGHNAAAPATVLNSGVINASGTTGGNVKITGDQVTLAAGSTVNVSGQLGGGTALIGGGPHGADASVQDSEQTTVAAGATISADALSSGNGGQVTVWGDSDLFAGLISARGGSLGGNGGAVEVSGHQLAFSGQVNTLAPKGTEGNLLLDPTDLTIDNGSDSGATISGGIGSLTGDSSELTWNTIIGNLNSTAVTLSTSGSPGNGPNFGSILINDSPANATTILNPGASLTLDAAGDVTVAAPVTTFPGGSLLQNLTLKSGSGGAAGYMDIDVNSPISVSGTLSLTAFGNIEIGGNLAASTVTAQSGAGSAIQLDNNVTTTGAQTYSGNVNLGGDITLTGESISFGGAVSGAYNLTDAGATTFGGLVSVGSLADTGTTAINGGGVTTAGSQIYAGAVTLGENTANSGSGILYQNAVSGAYNLTDSGGTTFEGPVNVQSLSDIGLTVFNGGGVTTAAGQEYDGAVILDADTVNAGSTITYDSTVTGGYNLADTGATTFGGLVDVGSLADTGTTAINGGGVTTANTQIYDGAVTLGANAPNAGTTISYESTVTGPYILADTGATTFGGLVNVSSLADTGPTAINGGGVTTVGNQIYAGAVTLGNDAVNSGAGILYQNTVSGSYNLTDEGGTTFDGLVAVGSLTDVGLTVINNGGVATTAGQEYDGPVTLGEDTINTGSAIIYDHAVSGAYNLTDNGATTFGGLVAVNSLTDTGPTTFNGGGVTTAANQTYDGTVTLAADAGNSGAGITYENAVSGGYTLTDTGATTFNGMVSVGSLTDIGATAINGGGVTTVNSQTYSGAVSLGANAPNMGTTISYESTVSGPYILADTGATTFGGAVSVGSLANTGSTAINGGGVTTAGTQVYAGAVTLGADAANSGTGILYQNTVSGPYNLTDSGGTTFGGLVTVGSLTDIGLTAFNGGGVATLAGQEYKGAVLLDADAVNSGSTIIYDSTVSGGFNLANSGATTFSQLVNVGALADTGSTAINGGGVTTLAGQTYNGAVTLGGNAANTGTTISYENTLTGPYILTDNGATTFGGPVSVGSLIETASTAINGGGVTTSGGQTYDGAVTLGADAANSGSYILYGNAVNGPYNLTDNGGTTFEGLVNVNSLADVGLTVFNGGGVATTAGQEYNGAVTLDANTANSGATIKYDGFVNGAFSLSDSGATTFSAPVTLGSLTDNGSTAINGGGVTTVAGQTYAGAVTLGADTFNIGTAITYENAVSGAYNLADTGATTFGGLVSVGSLTDTGSTIINGGGVTTLAGQEYNGPVTFGGNAANSGTAITYDSTLSGPYNLTDTGATIFSGSVNVASLTEDRTTLFNGGGATTSGDQNYGGIVTLGSDTVLTSGGTIAFGDAVNGPYNLTETAATTFFNVAVNVGSLTSGGGVTWIQCDSVTTTGGQTYNDLVQLDGNEILTGTAISLLGGVDFNGATLTLNNGGQATFGGAFDQFNLLTFNGSLALGANTTLAGTAFTLPAVTGNNYNLTLNNGGLATLDGAVSGVNALVADGAGTLTADGTISAASLNDGEVSTFNGGTVTTTADQTYSAVVTLGNNLTLTGGSLDLESTITGGGYSLTLDNSGVATLGGAVSGVNALVADGAGTLTADGTISAASLNDGEVSTFYGGSVTTTAGQTYSAAVTLGANTLNTGSAIMYGSTVTSPYILTDNGATTFGGPVSVGSLIETASTAINGGGVTTTGGQTYDGAVTLGADAANSGSYLLYGNAVNGPYNLTDNGGTTFEGLVNVNSLADVGLTVFNGGGVATTAGQEYNGAVTLDANVANSGATIKYDGSVNGAFSLSDSGATTFSAPVTLGSLTDNGSTAINGGGVTTVAGQTYAGAVTLGADTFNIGTAITYENAVSGAHNLADSGATTFGGLVNVNTLTDTGSTAINGGGVTTAAGQEYNGPVTLGGNAANSGTAITYDNTVSGPYILTDSGATIFSGLVNVGSLADTGSTAINGGGVTTAGTQVYGGAVTLGADAANSGTGILYQNTVSGPYNLTDDGGTTFEGSVNVESLSDIGLTVFNGGNVTTSAGQEYNGPVTLAADTANSGTTVIYDGTVGGPYNLTDSGATTFGGLVNVNSLADAGSTAINGGGVTTATSQTYGGNVTLGADAVNIGTAITYENAVSGAFNLADSGATTFGGLVNVNSLTDTGSTVINGGGVMTVAGQEYNGPVTLGSDTLNTGTAITYDSTVSGQYNLTDSGATIFSGLVNVGSLADTGTTAINGGGVTTATTQTYNGAVTLGADAVNSGTAISYEGAAGGPFNLADNGATTFSGLVDLNSLADTGSTAINGGGVTTARAQEYDGAVTLGANAVNSGTTIMYDSTVTGAYNLADSGPTTFGGLVNVGSLADTGMTVINGGGVTTVGIQIYDGAVTLGADAVNSGSGILYQNTVNGPYALTDGGGTTFDGLVNVGSLTDSGLTVINGGGVTTSASQEYAGPVTLGADTANNGTAIAYESTVSGSYNLADSGATTFGGLVTVGSLTDNGSTAINGGGVTTVAGQEYYGPVTLGANAVNVGTTIAYDNTVGGQYNLSDIGATSFGGLVTVGSLTDTGSTFINGGGVTTLAGQEYNGPVNLGANAANSGTAITYDSTVSGPYNLTDSGATIFSGLVNVGSLADTGTTAINGGGVATATTQTYDGTVTLGSDAYNSGTAINYEDAVSGPYNLADSGATTFGGLVTVGSLAEYGTTVINGGGVTTTAGQEYGGAVTLGAAAVNTGTTITYDDAVSGLYNLTDIGTTTFGSSVNVESLADTGTTVINGGGVTTAAAQEYNGPVMLGANTANNGTAITYDNTVSGSYNLADSGATTFSGLVNVGSLADTGTTAINGGGVATATTQTYDGAVTLGADAYNSGTAINYEDAVGGPYNLADSGATTFGGSVIVGSLLDYGTTAINGGGVTTTAGQEYDGAVTLGAEAINTGTTITYDDAVSGSYNLTDIGTTTFGSSVNVESLADTGTTVINGGGVTTVAGQEYNGPVFLGADTANSGTTILYDSTVDGSYNLTDNGATTFGGFVSVNSLADTGATAINGGGVTTANSQTYYGTVTLGANAVNTGTTITYDDAVSGPYSLADNGATTFSSSVNLGSLTDAGSTAVNGGEVTTTGSQTYNGAVTLGADGYFTGSSVDFASTVDGTVRGEQSLTVTADNPVDGMVTFGGVVGGQTELSDVTIMDPTEFLINQSMYGTGTLTVKAGSSSSSYGSIVIFQSPDAVVDFHVINLLTEGDNEFIDRPDESSLSAIERLFGSGVASIQAEPKKADLTVKIKALGTPKSPPPGYYLRGLAVPNPYNQ